MVIKGHEGFPVEMDYFQGVLSQCFGALSHFEQHLCDSQPTDVREDPKRFASALQTWFTRLDERVAEELLSAPSLADVDLTYESTLRRIEEDVRASKAQIGDTSELRAIANLVGIAQSPIRN